MGLGVFLDEPDLDERLSRRARRRLSGLEELGEYPDETPEFHWAPKSRERSHLSEPIKKAKGTKAVIQRMQTRDSSIPGHIYEALVLYFMRNPQATPRDITSTARNRQNDYDYREHGTYQAVIKRFRKEMTPELYSAIMERKNTG